MRGAGRRRSAAWRADQTEREAALVQIFEPLARAPARGLALQVVGHETVTLRERRDQWAVAV